MSIIKPRMRGKRLVKYNTRLDEQNQETLYAYAEFLGELAFPRQLTVEFAGRDGFAKAFTQALEFIAQTIGFGLTGAGIDDRFFGRDDPVRIPL